MTIPQEPDHTRDDAPSPGTEPDTGGWVQEPEPEMPPGYDQPTPSDDPTGEEDDQPSNVDDDGTPHFALVDTTTTADDDICGGCGQAWPCDQAYELGLVPRPEQAPEE